MLMVWGLKELPLANLWRVDINIMYGMEGEVYVKTVGGQCLTEEG